jgi:multidrug efflux pump subunit AcrA (membrane-fusion protein)
MVLPIQAVKSVETEAGSQHVVFVHTEERPENAIELDYPVDGIPEEGYYPIPVTIGISDNQSVEILEGVEVGMEVFQQVMYNSMW